MQDYFESKSRAPSPSLDKARRGWYSLLPAHNNHSQDVVKVFLKLFRMHIPKTFSIFKDIHSDHTRQSCYNLAMAATGGLFCAVLGSAEVAKSMYNDARRLLLASVSPD